MSSVRAYSENRNLAFFLFFSGAFRNDIPAIARALFVAFLYGSIVWGLFPIRPDMSWEGHLMGAIAGVLCAFYFRKVDVPEEPEWMQEEEYEEPEWEDIPAEDKEELRDETNFALELDMCAHLQSTTLLRLHMGAVGATPLEANVPACL